MKLNFALWAFNLPVLWLTFALGDCHPVIDLCLAATVAVRGQVWNAKPGQDDWCSPPHCNCISIYWTWARTPYDNDQSCVQLLSLDSAQHGAVNQSYCCMLVSVPLFLPVFYVYPICLCSPSGYAIKTGVFLLSQHVTHPSTALPWGDYISGNWYGFTVRIVFFVLHC